MQKTSVLIIYTGGTIGMVKDEAKNALYPFKFDQVMLQTPELMRFDCDISAVAFNPPIDSSNVSPQLWIRLAEIIEEEYHHYDGFVVLHGTDTMAYSASALSFMLENLEKPVVFTGSQLPIGSLRTDAKDNLIGAIEVASAVKKGGQAMVPEVSLYFQNHLYRGNRTSKINVDQLNAFASNNYPALAESGVHVNYNKFAIRKIPEGQSFTVHKLVSNEVIILKLFPGISQLLVDQILQTNGLRGIVLELFGAGNAPSASWFLQSLRNAVERGIIILAVTQCIQGRMEMGMYETSIELKNLGIIDGRDLTTEAAITKLMCLLGRYCEVGHIRNSLNKNMAGEMSVDDD